MDNFYKNCPPRMSDGRFLRDHRTSHRRELNNMQVNGIERADDYRLHLQNNASAVMDKEWCNMRNTKSCNNYPCFHNYPTRCTPGDLHAEMSAYNSVKTGKTTQAPACENFLDYRLTTTSGSDKKCSTSN